MRRLPTFRESRAASCLPRRRRPKRGRVGGDRPLPHNYAPGPRVSGTDSAPAAGLAIKPLQESLTPVVYTNHRFNYEPCTTRAREGRPLDSVPKLTPRPQPRVDRLEVRWLPSPQASHTCQGREDRKTIIRRKLAQGTYLRAFQPHTHHHWVT